MANNSKKFNKDKKSSKEVSKVDANSMADESSAKKEGGKFKNASKDKKVSKDTSLASKPSGRSTSTPFGMNATLLSNAANLFFSTPIGKGVDCAGNSVISEVVNPSTLQDFTSAGIMVYNFVPTPGISKDSGSAISTAMRDVFTHVCMFNSRTPSYGAADVIMYILAVKSMFILHAMGVRAYGLLNVAVAENRYWPKRVLEALGWNYENLKENMAEFRAYLNNSAFYINRFKVPSDIALFDRALELTSNVYSEGVSTKSQLYAFNPAIIYRWAEAEEATDGSPNYLEAQSLISSSQGSMTFGYFKDKLDTLYKSISDSQSCAIINSDISRAYTNIAEGALLVPDLYIVVPTIDRDDMLMGINNATVYDTDPSAQGYPISTFNVTQSGSKNILYFSPEIPHKTVADLGHTIPSVVACDHILNLRNPIPEARDIVYGAQFMSFAKPSTTEGKVSITECSDILLLSARIFHSAGGALAHYSVPTYMIANVDQEAVAGAAGIYLQEYMDVLGNLAQFDWHHPVRAVVIDAAAYDVKNEGKTTYVSPEFRDLDNYTVVTESNIAPIHEAMFMGMLGITG